jgi:hypothetical protein
VLHCATALPATPAIGSRALQGDRESRLGQDLSEPAPKLLPISPA